jgi:hypothetical protein
MVSQNLVFNLHLWQYCRDISPKSHYAFVELIGNSKDHFTRILAVQSLGEIAPGNSDAISAISAIVELTRNSKDYNIWEGSGTEFRENCSWQL